MWAAPLLWLWLRGRTGIQTEFLPRAVLDLAGEAQGLLEVVEGFAAIVKASAALPEEHERGVCLQRRARLLCASSAHRLPAAGSLLAPLIVKNSAAQR